MFRRALSRRSLKSAYGVGAAIAAAATLSACGGGGPSQDANEPSGNFPVQAVATLPELAAPRPAHAHGGGRPQHRQQDDPQRRGDDLQRHLRIPGSARPGIRRRRVRRRHQPGGRRQPVAPDLDRRHAARPVHASPTCSQGGSGGAVTAYSNTWALGALAPGKTATFVWRVTAVQPGVHTVAWEVAAGLNGKAKAVQNGTHAARQDHGPGPQGAGARPTSRTRARSSASSRGLPGPDSTAH